jgi:hypothetical protein
MLGTVSLAPAIDIADETYVGCPPALLAPVVADPASWARWWPDLRLSVTRDRGVKGQQWAVRGALTGSMEIWLEPVGPGTVLHWFLRADPPSGARPGRPRGLDKERQRRVRAWKVHAFALKDRLEGAERVT